ncbi:hypothetical protein J4461_04475 [Candidatus Pacearchaeota archaeon]|nr:hypothetical protein [Candidatus Pacearchaeota archaeon]
MDDVIDKLEFMTEAAHGMYKCISDGINGSRLGPISNVLFDRSHDPSLNSFYIAEIYNIRNNPTEKLHELAKGYWTSYGIEPYMVSRDLNFLNCRKFGQILGMPAFMVQVSSISSKESPAALISITDLVHEGLNKAIFEGLNRIFYKYPEIINTFSMIDKGN